jgi:hypothetical protein
VTAQESSKTFDTAALKAAGPHARHLQRRGCVSAPTPPLRCTPSAAAGPSRPGSEASSSWTAPPRRWCPAATTRRRQWSDRAPVRARMFPALQVRHWIVSARRPDHGALQVNLGAPLRARRPTPARTRDRSRALSRRLSGRGLNVAPNSSQQHPESWPARADSSRTFEQWEETMTSQVSAIHGTLEAVAEVRHGDRAPEGREPAHVEPLCTSEVYA